MKYVIISLIALTALIVADTAFANPSRGARVGGYQQGYSGTAAGRGSMVNKSGFVKSRTNEENHMDGKEAKKDDSEGSDEAMPASGKPDTTSYKDEDATPAYPSQRR